MIDVYYGLAAHQENGLKLALYGLYFPNLISGPILKYREHADQFFAPHAFDYRQVTRGLQRMVWGFFKKLVISERLGVLVNTVYGSYESYNGAYIWVATACYAFQLYTDFSGCMDIVLGLSESLGIMSAGKLSDALLFKKRGGVLAQMAHYAGNLDEGLCFLSPSSVKTLYKPEQIL